MCGWTNFPQKRVEAKNRSRTNSMYDRQHIIYDSSDLVIEAKFFNLPTCFEQPFTRELLVELVGAFTL